VHTLTLHNANNTKHTVHGATMNIKQYITLLAILLLLAPASIAISEPQQIGSDINRASYCNAYPNFWVVTSWGNYTATACPANPVSSGEYLLQVYNTETGSLIFNQTDNFPFVTGAIELGYNGGFLFVGGSSNGQIYDVSNPGFIERLPWPNCGKVGLDGMIVYTNQGENLYFSVISDATPQKWNQTYCGNAGTTLNNALTSDSLSDVDNEIFTIGANMYRYTSTVNEDYPDDFSDTIIYTIPPGKGTLFKDWNKNPNNPIYVTDTGYFVTVGGSSYDDFASTSLNQFTGSVLYIGDTDNVISVANNTWYLSDYTDFASPTHLATTTLTGAEIYERRERTVLNRLVTKNLTQGTARVWSIPEPNTTIFAEDEEQPPTIEAQFIGVDNSKNFVFLTEMNDVNGGRVYYDQQLYPADIDVSGVISNSEFIGFSSEEDIGFQTTTNMGIPFRLGSSVTISNDTLQVISPLSGYTRTEFTDLLFSNEAEYYYYSTSFRIETCETCTAPLGFSLLDISTALPVIELRIEHNNVFGSNNSYDIYRVDGGDTLLATGVGLNDEFEEFEVIVQLNYTSQNAQIDIGGSAGEYYSGSIPFANVATGMSTIQFDYEGSWLDNNIYNIYNMFQSYDTSVSSSLDYTLFDNLEAGVGVVKASAVYGALEFGDYSMYSYATDEDLGFSYVESFDIETFTYDEDTSVLTQDDIDELVLLAQSGSSIGALVEFVEGDLLTDKLNSAIEDFGFLSSTSKFLIALGVIMLFVIIGYNYGMIGSFIGGAGGLVLTFFLGWIPAWVLLTFILGLILLVAFEARRMIGGR